MLLAVLTFPALAAPLRLNETELRQLEVSLAPEVAAVTGRDFAYLPSLELGTADAIAAQMSASWDPDDPDALRLKGELLAEIDHDLARYVGATEVIYVNRDNVDDLIRRAPGEGTPYEAIRAVLAHELTHALQAQYGGLAHDPVADLWLAEGFAGWVSLRVADPGARGFIRHTIGAARLDEPDLDPEAVAYIHGFAAVDTLIAATDVEHYWRWLRAGSATEAALTTLANAARRPAWDGPTRVSQVANVVGLPPDRKFITTGQNVLLGLCDPAYDPHGDPGGPAVLLQWPGKTTPTAAGVLTFGSPEAATDAMEQRRRTFGRLDIPMFIVAPPYRTITVVPRLRPGERGPGHVGGFVARSEGSHAAYQELWTQVGSELRFFMTNEPLSRREAGDRIRAFGALPESGLPLGAKDPAIVPVLDTVRGVRPADPIRISERWAARHLRAVAAASLDCLAELAALEPRLVAAAVPGVVGAALECGVAQKRPEVLTKLAPRVGTGEPWDEANLLLAEAAVGRGDWPEAARRATAAVGLGSREARRDAVWVAVWTAEKNKAALAEYANNPVKDAQIAYRAIAALWALGDHQTAREVSGRICAEARIPYCDGWSDTLKRQPARLPE